MTFTTGDRVSVGPVSIFKSATMSVGDRVRGNDVIQRACPSYSIGDRVTADPIGIRKSSCLDYIWFTSETNSCIYKASLSDFSIIQQLGSTGTGNNEFDGIQGITRDNNYLYICDRNNSRIKKHRSDDLSYVSEAAVSGYGGFGPYGITTDGTYLYIGTPHTLFKYNKSDLSLVSSVGSHVGSGVNDFDSLWYLTTDGTFLYCADRLTNHRIVKRKCSDLSYVSQLSVSTGLLDIACAGTTIIITDTANDCITQYDKNLNLIQSYGSLGSGDTEFNNPWPIAADNKFLYLHDNGNHRFKIHRINDLSYVAQYPTTTIPYIEGITV